MSEWTHDRSTRRSAVIEAAKMLIHVGEHCSGRVICPHCEAWQTLNAAVNGLSPVDKFLSVDNDGIVRPRHRP
jgi:hypothetical protein